MVEQEELEQWLEQLTLEHRDLDAVIRELQENPYHDHMRIQRLKKRKLQLKDAIARVHSKLIPDLDA
ncbi:MAG: YdcH family protein [Pseudomonadota bacterium]